MCLQVCCLFDTFKTVSFTLLKSVSNARVLRQKVPIQKVSILRWKVSNIHFWWRWPDTCWNCRQIQKELRSSNREPYLSIVIAEIPAFVGPCTLTNSHSMPSYNIQAKVWAIPFIVWLCRWGVTCLGTGMLSAPGSLWIGIEDILGILICGHHARGDFYVSHEC